MKPSEFMARYRYDLEIDVDYVEEIEIVNKITGQTILYKHCSEGSRKDDKRSRIDSVELSEANWKDLDNKFIDREDLINIDAVTCLGLEVFKIQEMLNYFRRKGYTPYEWDKFKEELPRI